MRAVWTGAITFGLVNVPVKLYSATQDHDVSLHQVHGADGGRIRYERTCEVCGETVDYADIDKAYEEGGATVVLTADDLKALPVERSREIEVVEFVPSEQIDPVRFDRSYFLEPDANAAKAYALLLETLTETDRTAVVQFSLRQKTRLGALRAYGDVMMLQSLLWDDEVREADFDAVKNPPKVSAEREEDGVLAGREHGRRLRARPLHRRLPGAAAHAGRGQARAGRRPRHRGDLRRGAARPRARPTSSTSSRPCAAASRPTARSVRRRASGGDAEAPAKEPRRRRRRRRRPPRRRARPRRRREEGAGQEGGGEEGRGEEVGAEQPARPAT